MDLFKLMDILAKVLPPVIAAVIVLVWGDLRSYRKGRRAGKRLRYAVWYCGKARIVRPTISRSWAAFVSTMKGAGDDGASSKSESRTCRLFLWNEGDEAIKSSDLFAGKPFFINLAGGEISSFCIIYETDDLVREYCSLIEQPGIHPLQSLSPQVIALSFLHFPPDSGLVLEIKFQSAKTEKPIFSLRGPIAGLKDRKSAGTLWAIDLGRGVKLANDLVRARMLALISAGGFIIVGSLLLLNPRYVDIRTSQYWGFLAAIVGCEFIAIVSHQRWRQIAKKIHPSLAYWLHST